MSFTSKNLQYQRSRLTFLKGASLFFLGMSCVLFISNAFFEVTPIARNAVQYINRVLFTTDGNYGSPITVDIEGSIGNAYFAGNVGVAGTWCGNADSCWLHVNNRDTYLNGDTTMINGNVWIWYDVGDFPWGDDLFVKGKVGIGTTGPAEKLEVNGNIQLSEWANRTIKIPQRSVVSDGNNLSIKWGSAYETNPMNHRYWGSVVIEWGLDDGSPVMCIPWLFCPSIWSIVLNPTQWGVLIWTWGRNAGRELEVNGNMRFTNGGFIEGGVNPNQLYLKDDGNVGIGTNAPAYKLDIGLSNSQHLYLGETLSDQTPRIASNSWLLISSTSPSKDLNIRWYNIHIWDPEWIYVEWWIAWWWPSHRIGINNLSPVAMLDVDGGIRPKVWPTTSNPCTSTLQYPKGTQFYSEPYDRYCYCSSGNIARPMWETGTVCYAWGSLPEPGTIAQSLPETPADL